MRQILIIGAGKSTSVLISYLLKKSKSENLFLTIGDLDIEQAKSLSQNHERCKAIKRSTNAPHDSDRWSDRHRCLALTSFTFQRIDDERSASEEGADA